LSSINSIGSTPFASPAAERALTYCTVGRVDATTFHAARTAADAIKKPPELAVRGASR
jgi:hypothetical protein